MKKIVTSIAILLATTETFAQNEQTTESFSNTVKPSTMEPIGDLILPILFILFLVFMLVTLIKYFLDYRLKNKLIDRGMAEQLSDYLIEKNNQEKKNEVIKMAILFFGIGIGLLLTYFSSPIDIHSLAIMTLSIGLSYLLYFFYLRRQNK